MSNVDPRRRDRHARTTNFVQDDPAEGFLFPIGTCHSLQFDCLQWGIVVGCAKKNVADAFTTWPSSVIVGLSRSE